MAGRSKTKGNAGEREVEDLMRTAGYSTTRSRQGAGGDKGGPDVLAHGFRSKFAIESKRLGKKWPDFAKALGQAREWVKDQALVFSAVRVRRDREDGIVVMSDVDFADLAAYVQELELRISKLAVEAAGG